jgi:hypothetical protein
MEEVKNFWIKAEIEIKIKTKTKLKNILNGKDMAITNGGEITEIKTDKDTFGEIKVKICSTIKNFTLKNIVVAFFEITKHCIRKLINKFF